LLNIISGTLSTGAPPVSPTSYESIATANGTGSSGVITFSSIPSTFTHLQVRFYVLPSAINQYSTLRFNGDTTTANYRYHYMFGSGSSTGAGTAQNAYSGTYDSTTAPGVGILDILDYKDTNKYKTTREISGMDSNGAGTVYTISNLWMNTAAITSITFTLPGANFATATQFALYGIKGV
jgi:hypothetical protein